MVLLDSWDWGQGDTVTHTCVLMQLPTAAANVDGSPTDYSFDEALLLKFRPAKTQPTPEIYVESLTESGAAVDTEGNVVFMLRHVAPTVQTDIFRLDAKAFSVQQLAALATNELFDLIGGPGGQLLVSRLNRANLSGQDYDSLSTLHELIPIDAPDNYTHFFKNAQPGAQYGVVLVAPAAAAAAMRKP